MRLCRQGLVSCAFAVALLVGARTARADVIDGHWCYPDGKRISIQGPAVITPAGSHIEGSYSRHFFSYVAPQADADAGQTVSMSLINEDTVHLRLGSSEGPTQVWHRCGPPTS
jgi:hypothetical protein